MAEVIKIVLTGGPCGGKTTALNFLKDELEKLNIKVFILEEIANNLNENQGYVKTMWCGDTACEDKVKEVTGAHSRCIPFEQEHLADTCPVCGKKATTMIVWGRQY